MERNEQMGREIARAAEVLRNGGVIVYPTDTIWGIGCDAANAEAVARIYAIKRRTDAKSMLVLVSDQAMLDRWVEKVPETAEMLMEVADKPMTIIYDHPKGVAENLKAGDGSLGIRVTSDRFCSLLCRKLGRPVVSTSANISGHKSPASFADIEKEILDAVDYVVDWRREEPGGAKPSSIIKVGDDEVVKVIR